MGKRNIFYASLGGTIASVPKGENGTQLEPEYTGKELLEFLKASAKGIPMDYDRIKVADPFKMDSTDMNRVEYTTLAKLLYDAITTGKYKGVVISQGTDKIANTAMNLSFSLPFPQIPIIYTGSMH